MPGKLASWQSPSLSSADADVHRHVATAAAHWNVQRAHLKAQLEHERARTAEKAILAKRSACVAAKRTSSAWSTKEAIANTHAVEQEGIAVQEASMRTAEAALAALEMEAREEMQATRNAGRRIALDERQRALDARGSKHGVALWKRGMQRGRMEQVLHAKEAAEERASALKGFAAAERIEAQHEALNEILRQAPTSSDIYRRVADAKGTGSQTEADRLRSVNHPKRMSTTHLEKHEAMLKKVATARYDSWRQKVDVPFAPGVTRLLTTL